MEEKRGHDGLTHAERITRLSQQREVDCYNCTRLRTVLRGLVVAIDNFKTVVGRERSLNLAYYETLQAWTDIQAAIAAAEAEEGR